MIAILHEDQLHIAGDQGVHELFGLGPGNIGVGGAVNQACGNVQVERSGQHEVSPTVLEQGAGDHIRSLGIGRWRFVDPGFRDLGHDIGTQTGGHQVFGEIGCRCNGDETCGALLPVGL